MLSGLGDRGRALAADAAGDAGALQRARRAPGPAPRTPRREQDDLDLAGPLEEVRERLDDIVERERSTLSFRAEDDARMREAFLDALPPDAPAGSAELSDYRFVDPEAQAEFDELMERLREQVDGRVLPQHGRGDALDVARGPRPLPRHARRAEPT